jgi:NAD-dependent deacetylase sirtuin 4
MTLVAPLVGPLDPLFDILRDRPILVLAGAGCSTESGIPDYRGPEGSLRGRSPVQYQEFAGSAGARARYWARSAVGWPRMQSASPNSAHRALAELERAGRLASIITQNVDGLHHKAGSRRVVELHGSLARVRCLECDEFESRADYQERLLSANPQWSDVGGPYLPGASEAAPDGDAEVAADFTRGVVVPGCLACGGVLKPDVVFFGENVPKARVDEAWRAFEEAEVLLVVGSSLTVYSGRRFIYRAAKEGVPIGIINLGPTRADEFATVKVDGRLGEVLPKLADLLMDRG